MVTSKFEKECLFFFFFVLEVSLPFLFISWQTFFLKTPTKILHYLFSIKKAESK
jgi:hypothetical protein